LASLISTLGRTWRAFLPKQLLQRNRLRITKNAKQYADPAPTRRDWNRLPIRAEPDEARFPKPHGELRGKGMAKRRKKESPFLLTLSPAKPKKWHQTISFSGGTDFNRCEISQRSPSVVPVVQTTSWDTSAASATF
jgi:hypothetical protein